MSERLKDLIYASSPKEIEEEKIWISGQIEQIGEEILQSLAKSAARVRLNAYQPYSKYSVGACLLTVGGEEYSSCNGEVVTQTETDHAERGAISKAISEGAFIKYGRKFIKAVAVSHSEETEPCGGCRQRIAEHAGNCLVMDVDENGEIVEITSLKMLFPRAFTPASLNVD